MQLSICLYWGHRFEAVTRFVLPGSRTSIVRGNYVHETSVKRRNKIVQDITQNVANVFNFYAIIASNMVFQCINIRQVPWASVFNTSHGTCRIEGRGFHHLPRDLANVNAWKTMFDPYIVDHPFWFLRKAGVYCGSPKTRRDQKPKWTNFMRYKKLIISLKGMSYLWP